MKCLLCDSEFVIKEYQHSLGTLYYGSCNCIEIKDLLDSEQEVLNFHDYRVRRRVISALEQKVVTSVLVEMYKNWLLTQDKL